MRFDRLDAALEGRRDYAGNAYLFRGGQYTRFVWKLDREDFGYPISLSGWGLPTAFQSGVDAAVNGQGAYADYAYFFKAGTYARYNWVNGRVDLVDQPLSAWKLPSGFVGGIDAILDGQGQYAGTTYFFKLGQYARYRWASDVCEGPFDIAPAWHLPEDFNAGIDAAVNGGADFSGNAYLFKDTRYVRYDWNLDRAGHGYPQPIQGNWKHGIALWADTDTALSVDRDARLREDDGTTVSRLPYPHGTTRGQAGWDVGMHFNGLKDLATKLRYQPIALPGFVCGNWWQDCAPLGAGQISRLAINAHGDAGVVALWGKHNPRQLTVLTLGTDFDMRADLEAIRDATEPDATVMFVGCLAGKSLGGTALLSALSLLMPGRKVVAFTTVGFSHGARQARHGSGPVSSTEPGMRDTNEFIEAASEAEEEARYGPLWNDLVALPWAHEGSPHAKVALNGQIIRGADL